MNVIVHVQCTTYAYAYANMYKVQKLHSKFIVLTPKIFLSLPLVQIKAELLTRHIGRVLRSSTAHLKSETGKVPSAGGEGRS